MEEARLLVAVRPRLLAPFEPSDAGLSFCGEDDTVQLSGVEKTEALSFDRVFGPTASNEDVFAGVAAPIVAAVMRGVNGAVAAYGQTGSGKTHTMRGTADDPGLVPRAVRTVFAHVAAHPEREFTVKLSYIEIYNEQLKNLLDPTAKLDVVEGLAGVDVRGCKPALVADLDAALRLLDEGDGRRTTAETAMNAASSRSHAVVRVAVSSRPFGVAFDGRGLVATLSLVDLAGSETAKKTGATSGERKVEGAAINKSLFALSRVIEALTSKDPLLAAKPPFRDSKLTHLLKPALERGASSLTAVVCAIHPAAAHSQETQSTLAFARKARCVVTRPVVSEELSDRDKARRLAAEVEAMKAAAAAGAAAREAGAACEAGAARAEAVARGAEAAAAVARLGVVEAEMAAMAEASARAASEAEDLRRRLARFNGDKLLDAGGGGGGGKTTSFVVPPAERRRVTWHANRGDSAPLDAGACPAAAPLASAPLAAAAAEVGRLKSAAASERAASASASAASAAALETLRSDCARAAAERDAAVAAAAAAGAALREANAAAAAAAAEAKEWRDSATKSDARWLRAQHDLAAAGERAAAAARAERAASAADGEKRAAAAAAAADAAAAEAASAASAAVAAAEGRAAAAEARARAAEAEAARAAGAAAAAAQAEAARRISDTAASAAASSTVCAEVAEARRAAAAAETAAALAAGEVSQLRLQLEAARRGTWAAEAKAAEAEARSVRCAANERAAEIRATRAEDLASAQLAASARSEEAAASSRRAAHDAAADAAAATAAAVSAGNERDAARRDAALLGARFAAAEAQVESLKSVGDAADAVGAELEEVQAEAASLREALAAANARAAAEAASRAEVDSQLEDALGAAAEAAEAAAEATAAAVADALAAADEDAAAAAREAEAAADALRRRAEAAEAEAGAQRARAAAVEAEAAASKAAAARAADAAARAAVAAAAAAPAPAAAPLAAQPHQPQPPPPTADGGGDGGAPQPPPAPPPPADALRARLFETFKPRFVVGDDGEALPDDASQLAPAAAKASAAAAHAAASAAHAAAPAGSAARASAAAAVAAAVAPAARLLSAAPPPPHPPAAAAAPPWSAFLKPPPGAKCGVCPRPPSQARVGKTAHPRFAHVWVCKPCWAADGVLKEGAAFPEFVKSGTTGGGAVCFNEPLDAAAAPPRCACCLGDGPSSRGGAPLRRCTDTSCGAAFCRACVARHFPDEPEAADTSAAAASVAPADDSWKCFLCRDSCPQRRGPPLRLAAMAAGAGGAPSETQCVASVQPTPAKPPAAWASSSSAAPVAPAVAVASTPGQVDKENGGPHTGAAWARTPAPSKQPLGGGAKPSTAKPARRKLGSNRALEEDAF